MRFLKAILLVAALVLNSQGQGKLPSGQPSGMTSLTPRGFFAGGMSQLFGENSAFTANITVQAKGQAGAVSVPGKVAFLDGKSRFEMDATKMKDANMRPDVIEQIKSMGMAEVQTVTLPEKKETYLIYPGLKAYAVLPGAEGDSKGKADLKKVEQGKETVDGHPTTKYKVTVKDDQGEQEFIVWNASDLKNFPIKIQMNNAATSPTTITFSDVKLAKPEEVLFQPPAGFQRYNDIQTMMQEVMMKRFAPPAGVPAPKK